MPSPITRKDAEYQYYTRKCAAAGLTVPATTPLVELQKVWHSHVVNPGNIQKTASDLKYLWLRSFSGATGTTERDLWEQAFVSLGTGLKPPSTLEELIAMFYQLAP